jgi:hypothetical protein
MYNIRINMKDMQAIHNQDPLIQKLQLAAVYLETIQELYQDKEAQLELIEPLQEVLSMIRGIRREVLTQELMSVLNKEDLPEVARKEKVRKVFQLLAKEKSL